MFWDREIGHDSRRDSQDLGAAVRRRVKKTGRKLRKRTWASARQSPRVRRRWGNLMNSASRGWGAELLRRSLGCRPGLTGANGVANRRKSFSEHFFPSPPAGITGLGVVRPEIDARNGVEELASAKPLVPVLRRWYFMAGFCENLEKVPARTAYFRTGFQIA